MKYTTRICVATLGLLVAEGVRADYTNNIMLTGYWPPTNEMIRPFSKNPDQNPDGWAGANWEGRGYDVYSFFPEFPDGLGQGVGDFEVDYQDTSADFWRIAAAIDPVAIITFGRGNNDHSWELEWRARNLEREGWVRDYTAPRRPSPSPPDSSVPPGHIRYSSLPMHDIADAVNAVADLSVDAFVDETGDAGAFLCEYVAYHASWYHDLHASPSDPSWNVAGGHIHVGGQVSVEDAMLATEITLRELIDYIDTQIPEPAAVILLLAGLPATLRLRPVRWNGFRESSIGATGSLLPGRHEK